MRRHLCVLPVGPAVERVERWRRAWDPAMAAVVPAHVTVTYPEEAADEELLLRRAGAGLGGAFRLRLGEVFAAEGGVFVAAEDLDGGWTRMRNRLLDAPLDFPAHMTVAHPRTSTRVAECAAALVGQRVDADVVAAQVLYTETTPASFTVLRRFPLAPQHSGG